MKKLLSVLLCTLFVASLAACGGAPKSEAPAPVSSSTPAPQPAPEPEPAPESASSSPASEAPSEPEMASVTFKDITLSYPVGAEVEEQDEGLTLGIRLEIDKAALMIQVNPDMTGEEIDALLESDESWQAMAQMMATSGDELEESAVVDFAGGRAGYVRMTDQMNDVDATMESHLFFAGGTAYMLVSILADEAEEQYGDQMRQMIDSVEVDW
ncbi:hypothetical protein LJC49_10070 [Ruminococcaceae bacterium OttesenSCG-928-I18]|nr:hypothetical protein [Ruminococcaceae bacterium OttesenSCG-928-I18]